MKSLAAICLLLLAAPAHASPPPMPRPAVRVGDDSITDVWEARELHAAGEALAAAAAKGSKALAALFPTPGSDLGLYFNRVEATDWSGSLTAVGPLGKGLVAVLDMEGKNRSGEKITVDYTVFVSRESGRWLFYSQLPEAVRQDTRIEQSRGEIWVSHARRWISADIEVDLDVGGPVARLETPGLQFTPGEQGADLSSGLRLLEVSVQSGKTWVQPRFVWRNGWLYVRVVPGRSRLRVRYEGQPTTVDFGSQLRDAEIQLHNWGLSEDWPTIHPMEVEVHVEAGERLVSSMPLARTSTRRGWTGWRGQAARHLWPELVVSRARDDDERVHRIDAGHGNQLTVLRAPEGCGSAMKDVLADMARFLPLGALRVLPVKPRVWLDGQQYDDLVLLQETVLSSLCSAAPTVEARIVLAHELAHRWFYTEVRAAGGAASKWFESLAEYLATSTVAGSEAFRGRRADEYARIAGRAAWSMTAEATDDYTWELSYARGLLLMTALEDRVGREVAHAALRRFVWNRRGQVGSWEDVVAAVAAQAGQAHADWFRSWLERPGAPSLHLDEPVRAGSRLRVTVHQSDPVPWVGSVELVFTAGGKRLASQRVDFSRSKTMVTLDVPAGAERLELDPDHRLPRAYNPDRSPVEELLVVDLAAKPRAADESGDLLPPFGGPGR